MANSPARSLGPLVLLLGRNGGAPWVFVLAATAAASVPARAWASHRAGCIRCMGAGRARGARKEASWLSPGRVRASVRAGVPAETAHGGAHAVSTVDASGDSDSPVVAGLKVGEVVVSWCRAERSRCRDDHRGGRGRRWRRRPPSSVPEQLRRAVRLSSLLLSSLDVCRGVAVPHRGGGVVGIALGLGESAYIAIPDHGVAADGEDAIGTRVGRPGLLG